MSKEIIGTTTSGFQYRLETDIGEKLGRLEENALDFITQFNKGDFTYKELEMIARNLESAAQYFGEQYGLGGTRLLAETKARVNHYNDSIVFENKAQDDYERYYAGFVEYGHKNKKGKGYVPARPFMRNALYTVSKASTEQVGEALRDLLTNIFANDGSGYQGVHKLTFGNKLGYSYHYNKPNFQVVNSFQSALKERRGGTKEFGEYKSLLTSRKQLTLSRGKRVTERSKKLYSSFSQLNEKTKPEERKKSVKKERTNKKGPKPYKKKAKEIKIKNQKIPAWLVENKNLAEKSLKKAKKNRERKERDRFIYPSFRD